MLDLKLLSSWIQPQHLCEDSLKQYRKMFNEHPARMVVLRDILRADAASRLGNFITNEAEYETLYGLHSAAQQDRYGLPNVTQDEWLNARENDRFFKLNKFVRIAPDRRVTPSLMTFLKFQADFNKPAFKQFFREITGLVFAPNTATFHSFLMRQGDSLGWHDDIALNYHLAFVFYLSEGWKPEFGGALHMVDPFKNLTKVEAEYNSLVIFAVSAETKHRIAAIEPAAGNCVRSTISGWLHKPGAEMAV